MLLGPGVLSRFVGRAPAANRLRLVPAESAHLDAARAIVASAPAANIHVGACLAGETEADQEIYALLDGARVAGLVLRWRGTAWALAPEYVEDPRVPVVIAPLVARAAWPQEVLFGPEGMVERIGKACEAHGAQLLEIRRQQMMSGPAGGILDLPAPEPSFVVRETRPNELRWLLATHSEMCREDLGVDQVARNPAGYERYFTDLVRRGRSFVGELDGTAVAKAELPLLSGECGLIEGVYTDPEYRGRGLATRLMLDLHVRLRRDGRSPCLYVHRRNARAIEIYRRCGYVAVADWATAVVGRRDTRRRRPSEW